MQCVNKRVFLKSMILGTPEIMKEGLLNRVYIMEVFT